MNKKSGIKIAKKGKALEKRKGKGEGRGELRREERKRSSCSHRAVSPLTPCWWLHGLPEQLWHVAGPSLPLETGPHSVVD